MEWFSSQALIRLRYYLGEMGTNLWRARGEYLLSTGIIAVNLGLFGFVLMADATVQRMMDRWGTQFQVQAYLRPGLPAGEVTAWAARWGADPQMEAVRVTTEAQARARFLELFPDLAGVTGEAGTHPFPASVTLTLGAGARTRAAAEAIIGRLEREPVVESVASDLDWIDKLHRLQGVIGLTGLAVGGLLVVSSLVVISNVIRLHVYARRHEIEIMELVGATGGFIQIPFVAEGMVVGAGAAGFALLALYGGYRAFQGLLDSAGGALGRLIPWAFLSPAHILLLTGLGLGLGALGASLAVRSALRHVSLLDSSMP